MPIKIPNDLPAKAVLNSEQVFVMTDERAVHQDIRPLNLLFLNLMPKKINTEIQYMRKLSNTPLQVNITLLRVDDVVSGIKNPDNNKGGAPQMNQPAVMPQM